MFNPDGNLTIIGIYAFCVLGILVSIVLPILKAMLPAPPVDGAAAPQALTMSDLWQRAKPYLVIGAFSLLTGILIVAFTYGTLKDWRAALLAGYAWDSTLQKIGKP